MRLVRWIIAAVLLAVSPALAQQGGFSPPDPYILTALDPSAQPALNYNFRTPLFPNLVPGQRTAVLIWIGDSLGGPNDDSAYTPSSPTVVQDISVNNGGIYQSTSPALACGGPGNGTSNGFTGHRLAQTLVTNNKADRVITACLSVNFTGTTEWAQQQYLDRIRVMYRRLDALGLLAANQVIFLSSLGGRDQIEAVSAATVTANYTAIINAIRAAGFTSTRVYLAMSSWGGGGTGGANGLAVRTGITNAISGNAGAFTGADTDTIGLPGRYDTNHFNAVGSAQAATLWYNQIQSFFP